MTTPEPCPICQVASNEAYHPFCSKHCKNVDLHRWLSGAYSVPSEEPADEFEIEEALTRLGEGKPS